MGLIWNAPGSRVNPPGTPWGAVAPPSAVPVGGPPGLMTSPRMSWSSSSVQDWHTHPMQSPSFYGQHFAAAQGQGHNPSPPPHTGS